MTTRDLKEALTDRKRVATRSPIPQRRGTVNKRELSKDSCNEKTEVATRVATRLKMVSKENKQNKTPPPFYRRAERPDVVSSKVFKKEDSRYLGPKDNFLEELEKELASLNSETWLESDISLP
jgi:hypothetical protein